MGIFPSPPSIRLLLQKRSSGVMGALVVGHIGGLKAVGACGVGEGDRGEEFREVFSESASFGMEEGP